MSLALIDFSEFAFELGLMDISLVEISCGLIIQIPQCGPDLRDAKKKNRLPSLLRDHFTMVLDCKDVVRS